MIFEILLTSCLAFDPTDCGSGRIQVEGGLAACRERARLIAANVPPNVQLQSYPCVEEGQFPEFNFSEIAPGVFVHKSRNAAGPDVENRGDLANVTFIIGEESVAVIDTGGHPWIGAAVLREIRRETALPISTIILTHMHPEHVLGVRPLLVDGGSVIAHANLAQALDTHAERYLASLRRLGLDDLNAGDIVLPDDTVEDSRTISLGNRELVLTAHPTAHTDNDLTVMDVETGTLILGDLVFIGQTPALDGSVRGWQSVLQDLVKLPAERAVAGHGPVAVAWPDGAAPMLRYLDTLLTDTRKELAEGANMQQAAERVGESQSKFWLFFDAFNTRNAITTFKELE